ncbi:MAG TPA: hypothetical protein VF905_12050 [Nitrospirota bacterium]
MDLDVSLDRLRNLLDCPMVQDKLREILESMMDQVDRGHPLSVKQRKLIEERFFQFELDSDEGALNLVSNGLVPRGMEVPLPDVLKNLPKKPPGKK